MKNLSQEDLINMKSREIGLHTHTHTHSPNLNQDTTIYNIIT